MLCSSVTIDAKPKRASYWLHIEKNYSKSINQKNDLFVMLFLRCRNLMDEFDSFILTVVRGFTFLAYIESSFLSLSAAAWSVSHWPKHLNKSLWVVSEKWSKSSHAGHRGYIRSSLMPFVAINWSGQPRRQEPCLTMTLANILCWNVWSTLFPCGPGHLQCVSSWQAIGSSGFDLQQ